MPERLSIDSGIQQQLAYITRALFGDDIQRERFEFTKERAGIGDVQWQERFDWTQERALMTDEERLEDNAFRALSTVFNKLDFTDSENVLGFSALLEDVMGTVEPHTTSALSLFSTAIMPSLKTMGKNVKDARNFENKMDKFFDEVEKLDDMDKTDFDLTKGLKEVFVAIHKQRTDPNIALSQDTIVRADRIKDIYEDVTNVNLRFRKWDMDKGKAGFQIPETYRGFDLSDEKYQSVSTLLAIAVESADIGDFETARKHLDAADIATVLLQQKYAEMEHRAGISGEVESMYNVGPYSDFKAINEAELTGLIALQGKKIEGISKKTQAEIEVAGSGSAEKFYTTYADFPTLSTAESKFSPYAAELHYNQIATGWIGFNDEIMDEDYFLIRELGPGIREKDIGKPDKSSPKTLARKFQEQVVWDLLYKTPETTVGKTAVSDYSQRVLRSEEDAIARIQEKFMGSWFWKTNVGDTEKTRTATDVYHFLQYADFLSHLKPLE